MTAEDRADVNQGRRNKTEKIKKRRKEERGKKKGE
jgi:hypothetical protein